VTEQFRCRPLSDTVLLAATVVFASAGSIGVQNAAVDIHKVKIVIIVLRLLKSSNLCLISLALFLCYCAVNSCSKVLMFQQVESNWH
jgi:hypothetical protein